MQNPRVVVWTNFKKTFRIEHYLFSDKKDILIEREDPRIFQWEVLKFKVTF